MNIKNIESAHLLLGVLKKEKNTLRLIEDMLEDPESCHALFILQKNIGNLTEVFSIGIEYGLIEIVAKQKKFCEQRIEDLKKRIEEL